MHCINLGAANRRLLIWSAAVCMPFQIKSMLDSQMAYVQRLLDLC